MSSRKYKAAVIYEYRGKRQLLLIDASSRGDAENRLIAIRKTGTVRGWPSFTAPSHPGLRPISVLWLRFRAWVWKKWEI